VRNALSFNRRASLTENTANWQANSEDSAVTGHKSGRSDLAQFHRAVVAPRVESESESFVEKLKKAAEKKSTRKQREEQAKRERARYQQPHQTNGE
jgi:hypothetical protein